MLQLRAKKKEQPKQVSRFNCTLKYGQKNRKMSKTIEICRDWLLAVKQIFGEVSFLLNVIKISYIGLVYSWIHIAVVSHDL